MLKCYLYTIDPIRQISFKVAVLAKNKRQADDYVRKQAIGCTYWRKLEFIGEGHPPIEQQEGWLAAICSHVLARKDG